MELNISLNDFDKKLFQILQTGIRVEERPFLRIAQTLNVSEDFIIDRIKVWTEQGLLSRFAPLYNVDKMNGGVCLAAMKVAPHRITEFADKINHFKEVGHNYERDHEFNLWFVILTEDKNEINNIRNKIENITGEKVYLFPKEKEYFLEFLLQI